MKCDLGRSSLLNWYLCMDIKQSIILKIYKFAGRKRGECNKTFNYDFDLSKNENNLYFFGYNAN